MTPPILNRLCFTVSFLSALASCNQKQSNTNTNQVEIASKDSSYPLLTSTVFKEKFITNIDTTTDRSYPCQLAHPDTAVYEVKLQDSESSIKQLGEKFEPIEDSVVDMPRETFCTKDRKQTLTVFFHYGDVRYEFSEFQVTPYSAKDKANILPTNIFVTNSGIKLGLPKEKITSILGKCFKTVSGKNNADIIRYQMDDFTNSTFLQRYNMPVYFAEYEFRENFLVRFRFGFEYP